MDAEGRAKKGNAWYDGVAVAAATLCAYGLASHFELHEWMSAQLGRFEAWQADEVPFSLGVLAVGLAWYAIRRRAEMRSELIARIEMERKVRDLLNSNAALGHRLIVTQEAERRSLARDLHDEVGSAIAALRAEIALLCRCSPDDHDGMHDAARRSGDAAEQVYGLVRNLLGQLRPAL
ncbi:MAG TPA: histidine kinase, partial [Casimicrobiaceae bacterium]